MRPAALHVGERAGGVGVVGPQGVESLTKGRTIQLVQAHVLQRHPRAGLDAVAAPHRDLAVAAQAEDVAPALSIERVVAPDQVERSSGRILGKAIEERVIVAVIEVSGVLPPAGRGDGPRPQPAQAEGPAPGDAQGGNGDQRRHLAVVGDRQMVCRAVALEAPRRIRAEEWILPIDWVEIRPAVERPGGIVGPVHLPARQELDRAAPRRFHRRELEVAQHPVLRTPPHRQPHHPPVAPRSQVRQPGVVQRRVPRRHDAQTQQVKRRLHPPAHAVVAVPLRAPVALPAPVSREPLTGVHRPQVQSARQPRPVLRLRGPAHQVRAPQRQHGHLQRAPPQRLVQAQAIQEDGRLPTAPTPHVQSLPLRSAAPGITRTV